MSHRKILGILLGLSILGLITGLTFLYPEKIGLCAPDDRQCIYPRAFSVGEPLTFGLIPFIPLLILLLFFPKEVFNTWKKFALVIIPISAIIIIATPVDCKNILCLNKEPMAWILSIIFALISLIIVIYKSLRMFLARRKSARI
ncbi:MAG: hypothetical protein HW401_448 [Parcubacteria group bacterium]|nr:hypothetical protein [Parcubacteria group bacterium]